MSELREAWKLRNSLAAALEQALDWVGRECGGTMLRAAVIVFRDGGESRIKRTQGVRPLGS